MTDTPPKPKRRRWRWLVIGLALMAALGVVGWLQIPKIDSRLVGDWRFASRSATTMRFSPDGVFIKYWHGNATPSQWRWSVRGQTLYQIPSTGGGRLRDWYQNVLVSLGRTTTPSRRMLSHELLDVRDSTVRVKFVSDSGEREEVILNRISE